MTFFPLEDDSSISSHMLPNLKMGSRAANVTIDQSITENTSEVLTSAGNNLAPVQTTDDQIVNETSGETAKMDTTQFIDDSDITIRDESHIMTMSKTITMMGNPQATESTLIDYLSKPIVLTKGTFATSDTFSIFNSFSLPSSAFASSQGLIWRQKLAGYFGIRMNMRLRMVINANKFQQGRYIMGWTPLGGAASSTSNLKNINFIHAHNATLIQRTTVPHVEVDLSTTTTAELLIPFMCAYKFYPLNTIISGVDLCPLGSLNIYPYSPMLAPTGSTSAGYTVYISLEDVSLYGAASAQAGHRKGVSQSEVANKNNGPISGIANAVSRGFTEFKNIPLLGQYASGVSWIADRVANVASVFGFSKPTAGDTQPRMQIVNAPCHSTVDGESDARALSFLSQPGTVPIAGLSGTDYDEMDFSYIKTKYAWFRTGTWSTTQISDVQVVIINVSPSVGIVSAASALSATPVTYLSRHFTWWRGSLKFRFKIVKTEYHSGRLQFAFYPTDELTLTGGEAYVNRVIVDIRDHSEIELVIPYIARTPWLEHSSKTGILVGTVVDPLTAPSSVSPILDILIEIAGGDDFEVAAIQSFTHMPTTIVPQGYAGDLNNSSIISTTIGNMEVKANPILMSSLCIGDKVSNLRALLKRYAPLEKLGVNTNSTLNTSAVTMIPDVICMAQQPASTPVNYFTSDFISTWASCYLFMSGGMRVRDIVDVGLRTSDDTRTLHTSFVAALSQGLNPRSGSIITDGSSVQSYSFHRVYQDCSSNNTLTVEIPQNTASFARLVPDCILYQNTTISNSDQYAGGNATTAAQLHIFSPVGPGITPQTNHTWHRLFRAGADDFSLSGFISIPPYVIVSSSTNTAMY